MWAPERDGLALLTTSASFATPCPVAVRLMH
jgi:hypothetical protein